jgi:hypothetical protein
MSVLETSRKEIKARILDLKSEINRLDSALELIGGETAPVRGSHADQRANIAGQSKKASASRVPRGRRTEQVLSIIANDPGVKASQVARACVMHPSAVHPILKKLVDAGAVDKSDEKGYRLPSSDERAASEKQGENNPPDGEGSSNGILSTGVEPVSEPEEAVQSGGSGLLSS